MHYSIKNVDPKFRLETIVRPSLPPIDGSNDSNASQLPLLTRTPQENARQAAAIRAGQTVEVETTDDISNGSARSGDPVIVRAVRPVADLYSGSILIAPGTQITGTIGSTRRAFFHRASFDQWNFAIYLDQVVIGGREYPIHGKLVSIRGRIPCLYGSHAMENGCLAATTVVEDGLIAHKCRNSTLHELHGVTIPAGTKLTFKFLRPLCI